MAQTKRPAPAAPSATTVSKKSPAAEYTPTVRFRLRTELAEGKLAFVGVGGDIEGVVNPTLRVAQGDIVQIGLVCVLGYADFRFADCGWRKAYPKLDKFHQKMLQRPSVKISVPPPA